MSKLSKARELLNLSDHPTEEQIKLAYRRLAAIHHPDRGGDRDKFDEINKAYRVTLAEAQKEQPCEICQGTGKTTIVQGFHVTKVRCTLCKGTGVYK
jgi:DnaJ-class molecular chaperone